MNMAHFNNNKSASKARYKYERHYLPHCIPANDVHVESALKEHCNNLSSLPVQSIRTGDNVELPLKVNE